MSHIVIRSQTTSKALFEGPFKNIAEALEAGLEDNVCLDGAALTGANLVNANLDGLHLRHADLKHANLSGANLSECVFEQCGFEHAVFHGACLCESSIAMCHFGGALFGATDISGADIKGCGFSTLSALSMNYINARSIDYCCYQDSGEAIHSFSSPPVTIGGLPYPVAILEDNILLIGGEGRPIDEWLERISGSKPVDTISSGRQYAFIRQYMPLFLSLTKSARHSLQDRQNVITQHRRKI